MLRAAVVAIAVASGGCAPARPIPSSSPEPPHCASALTVVVPAESESVLFVRPQALFADPQIGSILTHSFDDATEAALIRRAVRDGFDLRTIDRAVIAWAPQGTVYYAAGSLDARRVSDRLWERLLAPRQRSRVGVAERIEGTLGRRVVGLVVDAQCRVAAYVDRGDTRLLDRVMQPNNAVDPEALVVWRTRAVPSGLSESADLALIRQVTSLELRVTRNETGLRLELGLRGGFTSESAQRVRAAIEALIRSPLGELTGAIQWLDASRSVRASGVAGIDIDVTVPWRAAVALADSLHGRTGAEVAPEKLSVH